MNKELNKALHRIKMQQDARVERERNDKKQHKAVHDHRKDITDYGSHFKKPNTAHRRKIANIPLVVRDAIAKQYGESVFRDRNKFWEVMERPENKMWLLATR